MFNQCLIDIFHPQCDSKKIPQPLSSHSPPKSFMGASALNQPLINPAWFLPSRSALLPNDAALSPFGHPFSSREFPAPTTSYRPLRTQLPVVSGINYILADSAPFFVGVQYSKSQSSEPLPNSPSARLFLWCCRRRTREIKYSVPITV